MPLQIMPPFLILHASKMILMRWVDYKIQLARKLDRHTHLSLFGCGFEAKQDASTGSYFSLEHLTSYDEPSILLSGGDDTEPRRGEGSIHCIQPLPRCLSLGGYRSILNRRLLRGGCGRPGIFLGLLIGAGIGHGAARVAVALHHCSQSSSSAFLLPRNRCCCSVSKDEAKGQ